jgi:hypothetical protein
MVTPLLKRTMDAAFLNTVANHPDVRPALGGMGDLDQSPLLANPENVALEGEHGGFVAVKLAPGLYECHSMFLPEGRGAAAQAAMAEGLRYLFAQTDCGQVVTKCPENNGAAKGAARAMGFSPMFKLEKAWPVEDGEPVGIEVVTLTMHKWVSRDAEVEATGKWFHQRLEELTEAAGKPIPEHFEDPAHNRAVGAACLMFQAGNPGKAQAFYNLWARIAGYPQIRIMSFNPVIVDMDQVVVSVNGDDMEVLLCR